MMGNVQKRLSKRRLEMGEEAWAEYQKDRVRRTSKAQYEHRKSQGFFDGSRREIKFKLIEYKGGKCERCGYDRGCPSAYDFHHIDPEQKSFSLSHVSPSWKWETLIAEVDKCQLLCKNCHAEVEEEKCERNWERKRKESIAYYKQYIDEKNANTITPPSKIQWHKDKPLGVDKCGVCGRDFYKLKLEQKYCSDKCGRLSRRVTERPNKEELGNLIENNSWCAIGRMYNVSDNAVRKWAKQYDIIGQNLAG